jgi:hypothetical protein
MTTAFPRHLTLRAITDKLARGLTLSEICEQPGMPSLVTVMRWQQANAEVRDQFRSARQLGADVLAEQCLVIADEATADSVKVARLRISTRLRLLPSWAPQTYGKPDQQMSTQPQVILNFAQILSSPDAANVVIGARSETFPALEGQE